MSPQDRRQPPVMRRENPSASDEEIEARVLAWLRRPSGEAGDRLRLPARR